MCHSGGVPSERPSVPPPVIALFVVTLAGIALGAWLGNHRLALGLYFVIWGAAWFAGTRAIANNPEYLEHMSQSRAKLPWYRDRVDFVSVNHKE